MKKYVAIFQLYFRRTLQYRVAAWAGIITQLVWGFLEILVFRSFYHSTPSAFPMSMSALSSYIWLQQAFLSLYMLWYFDEDIFEMIRSGQLAYELVRPLSLYQTWYMRTMASRIARTSLRCVPVLLVAFFLPRPYGLVLPPRWIDGILFVLTMILALCVVVGMSQLIYFFHFIYWIHAEYVCYFYRLANFYLEQFYHYLFFPYLFKNCLIYCHLQQRKMSLFEFTLARWQGQKE